MIPLKQTKFKKIPFRKIREALEETKRLLRAYRPLPSTDIDFTPDGWRLKGRGEPAKRYVPPFHPTVTAIEGSNNKSLTIGTGWFRLPADAVEKWDDAGVTRTGFTSGTVPGRRGERFKPIIKDSSTEIDDDSGGSFPSLTLTAGQETQIWATWSMTQVSVIIGGTTYSGTTGADIFVEAETAGSNVQNEGSACADGAHTHNVTVQPNALALLHQLTYILPSGNKISIGAYAPGSLPTYDTETGFSEYLGTYTLNSDGSTDTANSEWIPKENIRPLIPALFQSFGGSDSSSNPSVTS